LEDLLGMTLGLLVRSMLVALLVPATVGPALAEYILRPGDVLEIDIVGLNGFRQKLPVNADGTVRVPLVGSVDAAGKDLDQISQILQARIGSRTLRQIAPSGQEYQLIFEPNHVLVTIAEYRPVYVSGDVAKPGQQSFRPGLTVRQAVSLAGGYDVVRFRAMDPLAQAFDTQVALTTLWTALARDRMRVQRLRSELAGDRAPPTFSAGEVPLDPAVLAELARLEHEAFLANAADHAKEIEFLQEGAKSSASQIATVTEQRAKEREGLAADTAELERLLELERRGTTTSARVTEARRSLLISSTRFLQTTAQVAQSEREQADFRRRLDRLRHTTRFERLRELQEALAQSAATEQKIAAMSDKLTYTGQSLPPSDQLQDRLTVTIHRNDGSGTKRMIGTQDTVLEPGDVVEAALRIDRLPR
jgi:polysaccharide export outer membrane protein